MDTDPLEKTIEMAVNAAVECLRLTHTSSGGVRYRKTNSRMSRDDFQLGTLITVLDHAFNWGDGLSRVHIQNKLYKRALEEGKIRQEGMRYLPLEDESDYRSLPVR